MSGCTSLSVLQVDLGGESGFLFPLLIDADGCQVLGDDIREGAGFSGRGPEVEAAYPLRATSERSFDRESAEERGFAEDVDDVVAAAVAAAVPSAQYGFDFDSRVDEAVGDVVKVEMRRGLYGLEDIEDGFPVLLAEVCEGLLVVEGGFDLLVHLVFRGFWW